MFKFVSRIYCHIISLVTDHDIANESNEYERIRLINIKRNQDTLAQLGFYPSLLTENEATTELIKKKSCDDSDSEDCNDSVSEESSQAAVDSESDFEDVSYEPVEAFSETFKFPTPKTTTLLNFPREEYWSDVDRVFVIYKMESCIPSILLSAQSQWVGICLNMLNWMLLVNEL